MPDKKAPYNCNIRDLTSGFTSCLNCKHSKDPLIIIAVDLDETVRFYDSEIIELDYDYYFHKNISKQFPLQFMFI